MSARACSLATEGTQEMRNDHDAVCFKGANRKLQRPQLFLGFGKAGRRFDFFIFLPLRLLPLRYSLGNTQINLVFLSLIRTFEACAS